MASADIRASFVLVIISCLWSGFNAFPIPSENATQLLESLLLNYNKEIIPNKGGKAVDCYVKLLIRDMVPMDELPMHYTLDFILQLSWYDYRLYYSQSLFEPPNFNPLNDTIALPLESSMASQLWIPNIYFPFGKKSYAYGAVSDNSMVLLKPEGQVVFNRRIALASFCPMELVFYPFDIQTCNFHIESFSYSEEYLNLHWDTNQSISKEFPNMHMREFSIVETDTRHETSKRNDETYDSLVIEFKLYRFLAFYFLRDYFPCILIVVLSWISFWINYKSTPARVALGITTVLTIVTLTNSIRANSPPEGLFRSLDYYLLICNLFVFCALGEYALVGQTKATFTRYKKIKNEQPKPESNGQAQVEMKQLAKKVVADERIPPVSERVVPLDRPKYQFDEKVEDTNNNTASGKVTTQESGMTKERGLVFIGETHIVDQVAKILFPLSFIIFNGVYFLIHRLHPDTVD